MSDLRWNARNRTAEEIYKNMRNKIYEGRVDVQVYEDEFTPPDVCENVMNSLAAWQTHMRFDMDTSGGRCVISWSRF